MSGPYWPRPTLRQHHALDDLYKVAREHGVDISDGAFRLHFEPEFRPGRGHNLIAWYWDGEHVVEGYLDVYGNGPYTIAEHDGEFLCNTGDEDHYCPIHGLEDEDMDEPDDTGWDEPEAQRVIGLLDRLRPVENTRPLV